MATPVNGIYVLQGVDPAQIAAAPVAIKVVEAYDESGQLFTLEQVAQMKSGDALLLGYFSLGEAEDYRSYFPSLPASVIGPLDPSWPGNYEVAYWTDTWKAVAADTIDQLIAQGFGGAYFDVVGEYETAWAQSNAPGGDAAGAMVSLIQDLANHARSQDPAFKIWVNSSGGEGLMTNSIFLNAIDGAYQEELFYDNAGAPQLAASTDRKLDLLGNLLAAGKSVVAIEYVTGAANVANVQAKAAAAGIGYYVAAPDLGLVGVDTEGFNIICFVHGTRVATPNGYRPIEHLAVGDVVSAHFSGAAAIRWIGTGRVLATRGRRNAATPVIVRRGALADNIPDQDLRMTKGHALHLDGALIPVEFLINHRSIVWDDHAQEVTVYHLELETHDVLLANGASAESYRDDGNRWLFRNANGGWDLPAQEPCAPILTGGPVVDAAWRRLLDRAGPRPGIPTTDDPDLHLLVDGDRVDSVTQSDGIHIFRLKHRPDGVRILSRAGAPDELGFARDSRMLGVALRQIAIRGASAHLVEASDPALLAGFHNFEETNGFRWTDGDALLPASLLEGMDGDYQLELHVACTTQYPLFHERQDGARQGTVAA